jgi:hypothetical protein
MNQTASPPAVRDEQENDMLIHALVSTTTEAPDQPTLIDAWDSIAVEDNRNGWRTVVNESVSMDDRRCTEIIIDVPHDAIMAALRRVDPPTVPGTVSPGDEGTR